MIEGAAAAAAQKKSRPNGRGFRCGRIMVAFKSSKITFSSLREKSAKGGSKS
jgi:hypothetical protein